MAYEPPPNPADWICDALPSRHASESPGEPQVAPERRDELTTWAELIAYRNAYRARHGVVTHS